MSLLELPSLSPRLQLARRRALSAGAAVVILALPGAQSVPISVSMQAASAVNTREGESYYYDALWAGGVRTPQAVVAASGHRSAPGPYGVSSPALLTASGIPAAAYRAYVNAAAELTRTDPGCGIPWSLIAGIGRVESDHGRHGGSSIGADGVVAPPILGVRLDGSRKGMARIADSDGGRYDGDPVFDRAVGPMQFLPGTWTTYGIGNPQDMNAAALATARYLCQGGGSVTTQQGRWAAVFRYNHADSYVALVLSLADSYATGRAAVFPARPPGTPDVRDTAPSATPPGIPPAVFVPVAPAPGQAKPGTIIPAITPQPSWTTGPVSTPSDPPTAAPSIAGPQTPAPSIPASTGTPDRAPASSAPAATESAPPTPSGTPPVNAGPVPSPQPTSSEPVQSPTSSVAAAG